MADKDTQPTARARGSNGQRTSGGGRGGRTKKTKDAAAVDTATLQENLTRVQAELDAAKKKLSEQAARGAGNVVAPEPIQRLERPKGEAET